MRKNEKSKSDLFWEESLQDIFSVGQMTGEIPFSQSCTVILLPRLSQVHEHKEVRIGKLIALECWGKTAKYSQINPPVFWTLSKDANQMRFLP